MRKLVGILAALLLLGPGVAQATTVDPSLLDDPLHGFCVGCVDNGTNTPIFQAPGGTVQQFGFTASPANSGTLNLIVLVPNNTNLGSFVAPTVSGSGTGTVAQFTNGFGTGLTQWQAGGVEGTNPTLAGFFGNGASPDQNLGAYLPSTQTLDPGATGFFAFTLTGLGPFSLPTPGNTPPDLFNLSNSLPDGSYIVAFLLALDNHGNPTTIGTANSAALFVNPTSTETPLPGTIALFGGGLGVFGWLMRKRKARLA